MSSWTHSVQANEVAHFSTTRTLNFRFCFWPWHFPSPVDQRRSVFHPCEAENDRFCLFGEILRQSN